MAMRRTTGRFALVKAGAKSRKLKWAIERAHYYALVSEPCFYCELKNDTEVGVGLDRLDNSRGYEPNNVVSCCAMCNKIRMDHLSVQEMKLVGQVIKAIKIERSHIEHINLKP